MKNNALIIGITLFSFSCGNETDSKLTTEIEHTPIHNESAKTNDSKTNETVTISETQLPTDNIEINEDIETETLQAEVNNLTEKVTTTETKIKSEVKVVNEELETIETVEEIEEPVVEKVSNTPNHDNWNSILKSNVSSSGKVNYTKMKTNLSEIENYISNLESLADQSTWSKNEKLAYWINLYNAATVRLIVQNYPTSSITKINGGKPWDKKVVTISGKSYTLNQIENDIIRPVFKEPRIHFAVNCAAISCPKIMNSAFTADKLNYQLTKQAKSFINGSKNSLNEDSIEISKIFEWYAVDFGSSIIDYLNKYSTTTINSNAAVSYKEYNWDLNK